MTTWTSVPKPGDTIIGGGEPIGLLLALTTTIREAANTWTNLAKPVLSTSAGGEPIGLLLALTTAAADGQTWTNVQEPTSTSWTSIPKAT